MATIAPTISAGGQLVLEPADRRRALRDSIAAILGVTLFILAVDAVWRGSLPAWYVHAFSGPLWPRTPVMMGRAVLEEVKFRLVLMTALVWLLSMWRRPVPARWIVAAIILSQFANVYPYVIVYPLWGSLRFWLVGCIWGWLYWKHGWLTAAGAHCSCHLILDPLLWWML